MLNVLLSIVPTVLVLGVLIFVHELGHFLSARWAGVRVEKFSIGFGPEIIKWTRKDTEFALSLIPIGGFVKMAGETFDECEDGVLHEDDFLSQSIGKRFVVLFAGSFMNYVTAFFLLIVVFLFGAPSLGTSIGNVLEGSPAYEHGIQTGDTIIEVDGEALETWDVLTERIQSSEGREMTFLVTREGWEKTFRFAPDKVESQDIFGDTHVVYQIGVACANDLVYTRYDTSEAVFRAGGTLIDLTVLTYKSIYRLITGRLSLKMVSGPLGIMDVASKTAKKGVLPLLHFTAYLGVLLAVFNLLPFPALDGGHIFFIIIEAIRRKPVSFHLQERVAQVGFIFLMTVMVLVSLKDVHQLGWVHKIKELFFSMQ